MKLTVHNQQGQPVGEVEWAAPAGTASKGRQALHDAVVAMRTNRRAGTASTKTKGTVAGTGKKPWKQKGTGRARAGYQQSPLWRGGGVVFGPKPRDFHQGINRRVGKLALWRAVTDKAAAGAVTVVDAFTLAEPKTRQFMAALKGLQAALPALVVVERADESLSRASRNVPGVRVVTPAALHPYDVLHCRRMVVTQPAFGELGRRVAAAAKEAS
jgi:large subunit ribosomal protein L4